MTLRTFLTAFLLAFVCYVIGAFVGGGLLSVLSSNPHDRSVEAAMTGAFVAGPICGALAFAATLIVSRRRRPPTAGGG